MADNKIRTRQDLEKKIKEIFEVDSISLLISKQISTYVTERHYTYLDIGRALFYFYEIKNGDKSKCSGIGIVPYVIEESRAYFQELERQIARQKEELGQVISRFAYFGTAAGIVRTFSKVIRSAV